MHMTPCIIRCYAILLIAAVEAAALTLNGRASCFKANLPATPPSKSPVANAVVRGTRSIDLQMVSALVDSSSESFSSLADDQSSLPEHGLSPVEVWLLVKMDGWYRESLALKCPWMRRRALDCIDTIEMIARTSLIQSNNLGLVGPPLGCRADDDAPAKQTGLSTEQVAEIVRMDWRQETQKGYYVTGKMSESIYRDDCLFDGPDPDMPVKGLRKFRGAASQLFDRKQSTAELIDLQIDDHSTAGRVIVARWRMNGVLRLPFRPKMPEVVGKTTYYLDDDMLVYKHEEEWDISAIEAFYKTEWFSNMGSPHQHY